MTQSQELKHALTITSKVSAYLLDQWNRDHQAFEKGENTGHFATHVDTASHDIYVEYLSKKTPTINIHSEEGPGEITKDTWIIDPLEGTTNFRLKIPYFATQICLLRDGEPTIAVVSMPAMGLILYAEKGKGSFSNGEQLMIDPVSPLSHRVGSITRGGSNENYIELLELLKNKVATIRIYGATGVDMAHVALNRIALFATIGSQNYDILPGALLITEAGGVVKNIDSTPYHHASNDIVAGHADYIESFFSI